MAQKADYSLDYYSLNDVFYGRVNACQSSKQSSTSTTKDKSHKNSGFFSSLTRGRRSTSSYTDGKSSSSEHISSPRSSVSC